jgi:ATP-dependent DNA helicase RecG
MFSDEPQISLPFTTVKIARYNTSEEAAREYLNGVPETIEGPLYRAIRSAVRRVAEIAEAEPVMGRQGLEKVRYPQEAIHEIITNAVIHRDYSINDAIQVQIFNNRIEIISPGRLPAHITPRNILSERFARNPTIVRLLNKFPEPPNRDIGEGLNTAFEAMKKLSLREPDVSENESRVTVTLRHERLASPEIAILQYIIAEGSINNSSARKITGIGSENKVKNIFNKMMEVGLIQKNDGMRGNKTSYKITTKGRNQAMKATSA